jgi:hypothetical protein
MWESIKNLITGAKDALGIELPELPVDLGAAGEAATGAAQQLSESAGGLVEGATAAAESAGQVLPDLTNVLPEAGRK